MGEVFITAAVAIAVLMVVTWIVSLVLRDASIVDPVWGFGFVVVAWVTFWAVGDPGPRRWLLVALTTVWGLRLALHLAVRNAGHGEDYRYRAMREKAPDTFWLRSLLTVFLLQGGLMWIVSLPVQAGQLPGAGPLSVLDALGTAVWAVGLFFEAVGDHQLARFKADPSNAGRVLDTGLWRYTRHPNYFGDFMVWWGLFLVAAAAGAWWAVVGPLVMSVLLMRVSGVGLLESTIGERRPGYTDYVERTNAFFPGPPTSPT